jgi:hypothetical protein
VSSAAALRRRSAHPRSGAVRITGRRARLPRDLARPERGWLPGHYDGPTNIRDRRAEARLWAAGLVPAIYQGNPGGCYSLLYRAQALDIPVAEAFDNLYWNPTAGKGSVSAQLMAGLLRRAGYDYTTTTETTERVEMVFYKTTTGRRRRLGKVTWTIMEAVVAGLEWRELWQHYPADMLWARCLMRGARRYASEVATGLAYTREELTDMTAVEADPAAVSPDVQRLLEEATTAGTTAAQIKDDIARRARRAGLLEHDTGDGRPLGLVLGTLYGQVRAREVDEATGQVDEQPAAAQRLAGDGPLECGCPAQLVLRSGGDVHLDGCHG